MRRLIWLWALLCLSLATPARAHPMPNSLVTLHLLEGSISGETRIPVLELENALQHKVPDIHSQALKDYFSQHIRARSEQQAGQQLWQTRIDDLSLVSENDPNVGLYREVLVKFALTPPDKTQLRHFSFAYDAVVHQVVTHQILVFLQSDWQTGLVEADAARPLGVIGMDVRSGKILPLQVDIAAGSWLTGTLAMFSMGMKHIRQGLDHILFLLTLLLVAPLAVEDKKWSSWQGLKYTFKRFLAISGAFTLGHSTTLLIGSLSLLSIRTQWIEVLIAVSILISAINCMRPIFNRREAIIAGGFGLIHGLAFSMSLSGMQLNLGSKLLSVLGFNLGIEAMQLMLMLCFFPILWLSKWPAYRYLRIGMASLTLLLSLAWIAERVSQQENPVTHYVNQFFS